MGYLMFQEVILMSKTVATPREESEFTATAVRVSRLSVWGNAILTLFKLFAGIIAHSGAMISDAVHSASDVLSSFIVIIGVRLAAQDSDAEHPYGHEKFESVAAVILAVILCITGLFIGHSAIEKLRGNTPEALVMPGVLALVAAVVSIVVKEAMYRYTRHFAKKINSPALMAEAWHHRSDALSSIGSLIGIYGARKGLAWFDPVASLLICGFILKAAYDIFADAIEKMVDHACSDETERALKDFAAAQEGVLGVKSLKSREFGSKVYVDLVLYADGSLTLTQASAIAQQVHDAMEREFSSLKHIMVRVDPAPAGESGEA